MEVLEIRIMMKLAKYADLLLLTAGAAILALGLVRAGFTAAALVGGGVALILLGVYGGRK
jgi:hypothetical protein